MSIYTVHEPPPKAGTAEADPERFVFVRDGFSFWAFLLAPLWMLRHRMWLVFLGYVIVTVALQVGLRLIGASTTVIMLAGALVSVLIGFEAASLRRFTLWRRRWKNVGIVVGDDVESAERRFFDAWMNRSRTNPPASVEPRAASALAPAVPPARRSPVSPDVIGLFPQPGAPR
jgi:Protein of unknown function (DUF2628)